jgi:hypothetical protein
MTDKMNIQRVEFAPGVLEELEKSMSPEELQSMMDEIKGKIADGSFFTEATEIDMDRLAEEDPELFAILEELENNPIDSKQNLH